MASQRPQKEAEKPRFFELHCMGQLESARYPGCDYLYCKYWFNFGPDWTVLSGVEDGLTQIARSSDLSDGELVWNFPVDITFQSTNAFGWPQIGVAVYGHDSFGKDVIMGYGSIHLPTAAGLHTLEMKTFRPISSSLLQQFLGWLRSTPAEYIDVKRASKSQGRDVTRVQSFGSVQLKLNIVTRSMAAFGYATGTAAAST